MIRPILCGWLGGEWYICLHAPPLVQQCSIAWTMDGQIITPRYLLSLARVNQQPFSRLKAFLASNLTHASSDIIITNTFFKPTISIRPSVPPSGSHKCLRFDLFIYLLILTCMSSENYAKTGQKIWHKSDVIHYIHIIAKKQRSAKYIFVS